ncbi:uncharacterized protein LOC129752882 [Uranotaenia lowii]|uniref:uncharacterized protein LOC129752882 n=1 Tax=Uranotaenia lowii TaxID=190385 RepID=UPI0024792CB4|nr:uncharacterized protein LOC129752882 [Uranotaenia lowii]
MCPDSDDEALSIDDFPVEIFENIISYLDVEDRKAASLVSEKWSQYTFSKAALGDVVLEVNCAQLSALEYWNVLKNSSRGYRNIVLKFASDDDGHLINVLNYFQDSLEYLSIEQDPDARLLHTEVSFEYFIHLLSNLINVKELRIKTILEIDDYQSLVLPKLEKLKTLCLYSRCLEKAWIDWSIVAPNVCNLGIPLEDGHDDYPQLLRRYRAQLASISVDARFLERSQLEFCQDHYPCLRKFRLLYPIDNSFVSSVVDNFFVDLKRLTEISLFNNSITKNTIKILVENCTLLKIVSVDANEVPQDMFMMLSKLPLLHQLILHKITVEPSMVIGAGCFVSLNRLTCLSIRINTADAFFEQLHRKMPNLTILELLDRFRFGISNFNQTDIVPSICRHLKHLHKLALVDWAIIDASVFRNLNQLENLKDLTLKFIGLNMNHKIPPCQRVTRLIMDLDSLTQTEVIPPIKRYPFEEVIAEGFPNLQTVEMRKHLLYRIEESERVIQLMGVEMDRCRFYRKTRLKISDKDYTALL